jgi:hypothetical protein
MAFCATLLCITVTVCCVALTDLQILTLVFRVKVICLPAGMVFSRGRVDSFCVRCWFCLLLRAWFFAGLVLVVLPYGDGISLFSCRADFGWSPSGVGLSLVSCRSICTAPVRGGTYFLCGRKESRQRKRLTPPAFRCPPLAYFQSGPRTIRSLAHSALVTQHSFIPLRTACVVDRFAKESGGSANVHRLAGKRWDTASWRSLTRCDCVPNFQAI